MIVADPDFEKTIKDEHGIKFKDVKVDEAIGANCKSLWLKENRHQLMSAGISLPWLHLP